VSGAYRGYLRFQESSSAGDVGSAEEEGKYIYVGKNTLARQLLLKEAEWGGEEN